jgi:hypothetical protein
VYFVEIRRISVFCFHERGEILMETCCVIQIELDLGVSAGADPQKILGLFGDREDETAGGPSGVKFGEGVIDAIEGKSAESRADVMRGGEREDGE